MFLSNDYACSTYKIVMLDVASLDIRVSKLNDHARSDVSNLKPWKYVYILHTEFLLQTQSLMWNLSRLCLFVEANYQTPLY